MYKFPLLYVSVQLAKKSARLTILPPEPFPSTANIPALEISGNGGVVQLEALGGLLECRTVEEFLDGLPLSFGDLQNQRIVEPIDQVDGFVEVFVAGPQKRSGPRI